MKHRYFMSFVIITLGFFCVTFSQSQDQLPVVNIGVVLDGYWERNAALSQLFQKEVLDLVRGEFDVRFPEDKRLEADWTRQGVKAALDQLLLDPQIHIIVAGGNIASDEVFKRGPLPKPIIAPFVLDADTQAPPSKMGMSQVKNLSYIKQPLTFKRDVQSFLEIIKFRRLALLFNENFIEEIPEFRSLTIPLLRETGIDPVVIPVGESIDEALALLTPDIEAVYINSIISLPEKELLRLIDELIERKLPSFTNSGMGIEFVQKGIMATFDTNYFPHIARRVALNVQRILLGEEPGSIPVDIVMEGQLTINMETARAINLSPDYAVLTEAELLNYERQNIRRKLDLNQAVQEAVKVNLDLAAKQRFVSAGEQDVYIARSKLLPQINISGTGLVIDEDRAEASFGSQAERTLSGSVTASQIIFSEPAWANYSIQKALLESLDWELKQLELDITLAAATAYLNVLRAKSFERIQRENLKRIRSNLEIARIREAVGTAGPAEVFRWESEVATNRKALIEANAQRNLAEIQLNRLLHRPLEEFFLTSETGLDDPVLITAEKKIFKYVGDPVTFRTFRTFMSGEGLKNSPELAILDSAIQAQKRGLKSASNSFWLPTIALQGEVTNIFSKAGAGSEGLQNLPALFPFPQVDNVSWSVGLNLTFPLFKGGEKIVARKKAEEELEQLNLQRASTQEKIEQNIRVTLHLAGASFAGIEQARAAAEAADRSLEVVKDAYSRGMASILDLLDAQNAAFIAEQVAANAVYDFLIDLMNVERAMGKFGSFGSVEERKAFVERADEFLKKSGIILERH